MRAGASDRHALVSRAAWVALREGTPRPPALLLAAVLAIALVGCATGAGRGSVATIAPPTDTREVIAGPAASSRSDLAIRGRVTAQASGAPVEGVEVTAHLQDGTFVASATTDADGRYLLSVPSGTYYLRFRASVGLAVAERWWRDVALQREAHPIRVGATDAAG